MEKQLVLNFDKCTGCRMCEMACSLTKEGECNTRYSRIRVCKMAEGIDVPVVCLQCEDPACADACPVEAVTRDVDGTILIDQDLCIGCRKCLIACPFGAIYADPRTKSVIKCDLCGGNPACLKFCQPKAIEYCRNDQVDLPKKRIETEKMMRATKISRQRSSPQES